METVLPVGKLPPDLLASLLAKFSNQDRRVVLGPGIGLDCAVIEQGSDLLVLKSDPITFATDEIGWYAVQVCCNDLATTGATPRWFLATVLLPEDRTTPALAEHIASQLAVACRENAITVVGGHTEITAGLQRPIIVGTMIGEVAANALITPRGARPGDRLLLTKGVPVEATALLARELPERLSADFTPAEIEQARNFLYDPGIGILQEAQVALHAGRVTAMHDPTEGGLSGALWELAEASGKSLVIDPLAVPVLPLAARLCRTLGIDPLEAIASGSLLLAADPQDASMIISSLGSEGIACTEIGRVESGQPQVWQENLAGRQLLPRPARDAIASLFEHAEPNE